MPKPATLVTRPIYFYKKQIKTNYETQFAANPILNDEIKKNQLKKIHKKLLKSTQFHPLSIILGS
jgi:hypothetical protein